MSRSDLFHDRYGLLRWQWILLGATLGALAVVAGALAVSFYFDERSCETRADDLQTDHRYSPVGGCRFKLDDGRYVGDDTFIINEETR